MRVVTRIESRYCDFDGCDFDGDVDVTIDPETNSTFWECPRAHQHESTTWDDYTEDEDA
jgi:hypothetical protein